MSTSVDLAPRRPIADHDDLDGDVVALTHWRRGDIAAREDLSPPAQLRDAEPRTGGVPSQPPPDALSAWRPVDVDELDDEPDDLRLLARLRGLDELELPAA